MNGKLLGIDHGLKRIGIAVSDPSGMLARELTIINRTSNAQDFAHIHHLAQEQKVIGIVIGLPEIRPGEHTHGEAVLRWLERFAPTTPLPIVKWDEQLSSVDAREISIQKGRKARDPIDDLAARVILQSFLDAVRDGLATWPA